MGYDIAIAIPPIPSSDSDAWKTLEALIDQTGPAPAVFRTLHDRLTARYPCLASLPEDREEEAPWNFGPLWECFGARTANLGMLFPRVKEVMPFVIECSTALGLAVFDWQTEQIHRPDGFPGLTLTLENQPVLLRPTLSQVESAVDTLTPDGGPGFLIVEGPGEDYTQAAGGRGQFTAEWREYSGQQFKHWVAGIPGVATDGMIKIETNGCEVTVRSNERLSAQDVKTIVAAFAAGAERPAQFCWRMSSEG